MSNSVPLPSPSVRHRDLIYEHLHGFGDYIYLSTTDGWTQRRQDLYGQQFLLAGYGRSPTAEQISLFERIDAELPKLITIAIAAVDAPDPKFFPDVPGYTAKFTRDELSLAEVRLEPDETFDLFLDSPTGDSINVWPMVVFRGWHVAESCWVP